MASEKRDDPYESPVERRDAVWVVEEAEPLIDSAACPAATRPTGRPARGIRRSLILTTSALLSAGLVFVVSSPSALPSLDIHLPTSWSLNTPLHDPINTTPTPTYAAGDEDRGDVQSGVWSANTSRFPETPQSAPSSTPTGAQQLDADGAELDTRPATPSLLPGPEDKERYIAYLPHSGLHNQRIELQNALLLAHLSRRTLLLPLARLGWPLPWKPLDTLYVYWHRQQKETLSRCRSVLPLLEAGSTTNDSGCLHYAEYAQVSWEFLVDLDKLRVPVRLVERNSLDRAWLTRSDGLNVTDDSIRTFDDPDRYSWRIYDDRNTPDHQQQFSRRLNVEDLLTPEYARYDVLEFGSLFGSYRWILSRDETRKMADEIEASLTFSVPLLDDIADAIEDQLGGRAHYAALHLRVGDGNFKRGAVKSMQRVFRRFCVNVFDVSDDTVDRLIRESQSRSSTHETKRDTPSTPPSWNFLDSDHLLQLMPWPESTPEKRLTRRQVQRPGSAEAASCRGKLHDDPHLQALNARVYVATDSPDPMTERAFAPFRHAFPCLNFLSDFRQSVDALPALDLLRSEQEGVLMSPFLIPLLEALLAARARVVYGTKGSTFSQYVTTILHRHYWPNGHHRSRRPHDTS